VGRAACGETLSTPDEREELEERNRSFRLDLDLLFELIYL
jgi:hypothetical protein